MSLTDKLRKAENNYFTPLERHELGAVYRANYRLAALNPLVLAELWADHVADEYIQCQVEKWQKHNYVVVDGKHRRA